MRVDETPTLESKRGRGGPEKKTSGCDPHVRVESPVRPPPNWLAQSTLCYACAFVHTLVSGTLSIHDKRIYGLHTLPYL